MELFQTLLNTNKEEHDDEFTIFHFFGQGDYSKNHKLITYISGDRQALTELCKIYHKY